MAEGPVNEYAKSPSNKLRCLLLFVQKENVSLFRPLPAISHNERTEGQGLGPEELLLEDSPGLVITRTNQLPDVVNPFKGNWCADPRNFNRFALSLSKVFFKASIFHEPRVAEISLQSNLRSEFPGPKVNQGPISSRSCT